MASLFRENLDKLKVANAEHKYREQAQLEMYFTIRGFLVTYNKDGTVTVHDTKTGGEATK